MTDTANPMKRAMLRKKILEVIADQWYLIGIGFAILIASQVQIPSSQVPLAKTIVSYLCVSIIFLSTGCTLPTRALIDNYSRWRVHLFVQIQSFLVTSALAFAVVSACATSETFMDAGLLIGLIFTGCVPTTISSNVVMTRCAHGNSALTVAESTIGNFLAPFLTPLLLRMYLSSGAWYTNSVPTQNEEYAVMYRRVFMLIGLAVFLPMAAGQALRHLFPEAMEKVFKDWQLNRLATCCLIVIIWQAYDATFGSGVFYSVKSSNIIFINFVSIGLYFLWLGICFGVGISWLDRKDIVAVLYCVPAKSPAMGVPIANLLFQGLPASQQSKIQLPLVIFQGIQIAFGGILVPILRMWIEAAAKSASEETPEPVSVHPKAINAPDAAL
ncbi:hypothetical protein B7463_g4197, partial [Scytalidium lignicola]